MVKIRGLGYVGVSSPHYRTWADIGPNVFAMQLGAAGSDGAVRLKIDDYDYRISVHPGDHDRLQYIGWELGSGEDLDAAADELAVAGISYQFASAEQCDERRVARMLHCLDAAGLRFELFCGPTQRFRSFAAPRQFGGFVTGDQGFGHMAIVVPDSEAEDGFLRHTLGFKLTDAVKSPMGILNFYHVNRRHHSLATLPAQGLRGLNHVMLQVNDLNDVGIAWDLVRKREDLPFALTLGRHSTDQMFSFYVRTPTGFDLEYGWGAITLDDTWTSSVTEFPAEIFGHEFQALPPQTAVEPATDLASTI